MLESCQCFKGFILENKEEEMKQVGLYFQKFLLDILFSASLTTTHASYSHLDMP